MKLPKHIVFPLIISLILFVIPFFWLKPGEMDLGGDSTRLYFYDPMSYLLSSVLYVISPSSFGVENLNYVNLPFITLLIILKFIVSSPTILICAFYGFSLSMAFIFCYLIIKELIDAEKSWYAAVVGALVYTLSPALIDGWKHVLITYNQVFLNPLIFYLLLKYFKTGKVKYIFITILLTFIFSTNFSIAAAPPLFAFYPLSMLFLILYTKLILKGQIIVKHLVLGFLLFIGIQAFHILPQISNIFLQGSDINSNIFSNEGKFDRGLNYFSAIVPNIKASINLLGLPQMRSLSFFSNVFLVSPFVIVVAFFFNKKKTILLTLFFFLIILFFATANITTIWLSLYKSFFAIPGFSMFRNFGGQWQYTYIFFYSILFGQALYIVLNKLSFSSNKLGKTYAYVLIFSLILLVVINAIPLIKGDIVKENLWQSNNIKSVIQMDPDYEEVLSFIRSLPADGRVLTLPLSDPGYQVVAGKNGGAYMGPSTIAYIGGKKDFAGYNELQDYKNLIFKLVKNNELETLKRTLGILNIKYIFYNADPLIYDEFPAYPYQDVRKFLPKDQNSYKEFIKKLKLKEIKNIKNKFFVFELQNNYYLPQVFVAKKSINFNKPFFTEINVLLSIDSQENRIAVDNSYKPIPKNYPIKFDETLTDVQGKNSFLDFFISADASVGFPYSFSAWPTNSLVYPFVVLREKLQLLKLKQVDYDDYIETAILTADKRISELERWRKEVSVLGNVKSIKALDQSWQEPSIWQALIKKNKYNAWEIGFLRYQRQIYNLISKIEKPNNSLYSSTANKEKLKKAVVADRERFYTIIEEDIKLSEENKVYLLKLSIGMFDSIIGRLQSKIPSPEEIFYDLSNLEQGRYEVFIDKKSVEKVDQSKWQIVINGRKFYLKDFVQDSDWYKGQNIVLQDVKDKILTLLSTQSTNLLSENQWKLLEEKNLEKNSSSLSIINSGLPNNNGLIQKISDWSPSSYYILSFEYLTHGKSFKVITYDESLQKEGVFRKVFEDDLRSLEWKPYESIFLSSNDANLASLQILKSERRSLMDSIDTNEKNSKIEVRNLSMIKVPNPKIILKKAIEPPVRNETLPNITFTRVNPTKYEVKVENATGPYTLVLINQFNKKWRIIDPTEDTSTVRAFFSRFIASIGKKALGFLGHESSNTKNEQLTYFGGDVKENVSNDIFLNKKTFETWGKVEIAEYKHFPVNGNANAWYIEPADIEYKTDYDLVIEMSNQKLFYGSLFVSMSIAVFTLLLIVKSLKK